MKKNSNRKIKDYSKYDEADIEYYGLLYKRGKARIDVKRMQKKLKLDKEILNVLNRPRKTVYFIPEKTKRDDYVINIFKDTLYILKRDWNKEFLQAIKAIKTPDDARYNATTGYFLQTGILEYDELQTYGNYEAMKRSGTYNFIIKSMIAQYIHQIASVLEGTTVHVVSKFGYKAKGFNRESLRSFISKGDGVDIYEFDNYSSLNELYTVWNFLKHNTEDLFNKTKDRFPHLLYENSNYKNGDLAVGYLKIDSNYVSDLLDRLRGFYEELCEKGLKEQIEHSEWNYDDYFRHIVAEEIEFIVNPGGFPPTL